MRRLVAASGNDFRLVVGDLSTSPYVDMAGAEMLGGLHADLAAEGIAFRVVEARAKVREMLQLEGLAERLGSGERQTSLVAAVEAFEAGRGGAPADQ